MAFRFRRKSSRCRQKSRAMGWSRCRLVLLNLRTRTFQCRMDSGVCSSSNWTWTPRTRWKRSTGSLYFQFLNCQVGPTAKTATILSHSRDSSFVGLSTIRKVPLLPSGRTRSMVTDASRRVPAARFSALDTYRPFAKNSDAFSNVTGAVAAEGTTIMYGSILRDEGAWCRCTVLDCGACDDDPGTPFFSSLTGVFVGGVGVVVGCCCCCWGASFASSSAAAVEGASSFSSCCSPCCCCSSSFGFGGRTAPSPTEGRFAGRSSS
mmetsp:Transcript_28138/g.90698  ORF Transcript_28138/g.90698 Transcript_28138/m.90698 type:complete len:263 (+) Transcript_28138:373-1161(+)